MKRSDPITEIKGVGDKTAALFQKLNIQSVGELIQHYPRTYFRYPKMVEVTDVKKDSTGAQAVLATVMKTPSVRKTSTMAVTTLTLGEETEKIDLVWFRQPYLKNTLIPGKRFVFYGKVTEKSNRLTMEQPTVYEVESYRKLEDYLCPVYALTAGLTNHTITKIMRSVLDGCALTTDFIPQAYREKYELCDRNYAVKQLHFPDELEQLVTARRRLVFEEFFTFLMGIRYGREKRQKEVSGFDFKPDDFLEQCEKKLPYALTNAQKNALADIEREMDEKTVMHRLIQGDVGSGKTIVAFLAMARCAHNGYQSAIMAPTEVLARQHYETYVKMCHDFGLQIPVVLLTGSMKTKEKREAYEKLALYDNALIIGTHALIQERVIYRNLALVITDEQHRFGVRQRDDFIEKGMHPHVLVMSATPIPRTLAIILYGDLDISVIDEVPARRLPIKNCVVRESYRKKAYDFITAEVQKGHQAYVICPLVEESEQMEAENVMDYAEKLKANLPSEIRVEILHGKMKNETKNSVMEAFAKNEVQVLVATTVVEVGVNVPNATVMMIENADRFGLAQLHQLRGRVGRGEAQSYCIMINTSDGKTAQKRLGILNQSNDGFFIASEDLKLRGPGDLFGIRQSGELYFELADIYQDAKELQQASEAVEKILKEDPYLEKEEHAILKREMLKLREEWAQKMTL